MAPEDWLSLATALGSRARKFNRRPQRRREHFSINRKSS
jgi:hypothetical protein